MDYDAIVIGLGPAGSHFSYALSKLGYRVLAFEKEPKDRYKACAGGISPLSVQLLKASYGTIPSSVIERSVSQVSLETNKDSIVLKVPGTDAFTTYRSKFDSWLVNESIESGAIVKEECEPAAVSITNESVAVKYREDNILKEAAAHCLVAAYGVRSSVQRMLKLDPPPQMIAVQSELEVPKEEIDDDGGPLRFYYDSRWSQSGYSWIFPKNQHLSVGLLDVPTNPNPKQRLLDFIQSNPITSRLTYKEMPVVRGAPIPNDVLPQTYRDRILILGDAAGFADRITWEGISYALTSAGIAVEIFDEAYDGNDFSQRKLAKYQQDWINRFGKDLKFGKLLQQMLFDEHLDENFSKAIARIKSDEELRVFLTNEMRDHMSLVRAIGRLSLGRMLSLTASFLDVRKITKVCRLMGVMWRG